MSKSLRKAYSSIQPRQQGGTSTSDEWQSHVSAHGSPKHNKELNSLYFRRQGED